MEYRDNYSSFTSYTPRRKDGKFEAYGGLQLKTRTTDEEIIGPAPERQRRQQSVYQEPENYQPQSRGVSKRRESATPKANSSSYLYQTRFQEEQDRKGDESSLRDIKQRETRDWPDQKGEAREKRERRDIEERGNQEKVADSDYRKGSYMGIKRNQAILKENRKEWTSRPDNSKKENQPVKKAMDPQLIEKLCSISKLNSRISERLKSMTMTMEKHRV